MSEQPDSENLAILAQYDKAEADALMDVQRRMNERLEKELAAARAEMNDLKSQINDLAHVLLTEFGGPTEDEGACRMAVRVLRDQKAEVERLTKRCEEAREIIESLKELDYQSAGTPNYILEKWLEGKP